MACIYTYKGLEFQTRSDVLNYIKANNINPNKVNFARDVAFKTRGTGFTTLQVEEITSGLSYMVFNVAKGDIENFGSMDFNEVISAFVQNRVKTSQGIYKDRYKRVAEHIPYFVEQVKKFYKSKGIEIVEELVETEDGNLFIENTLTIDPKQSASAKVRALVSMVPKQTKNENGNTVDDTDTFLGSPKFVEEGAMWNTLKRSMADLANPTFEKMMQVLDDLKPFHPHMGRLKSILNQKRPNAEGVLEVDENLRTQFYNTFAISRVDYATIVLEGDPGNMNISVTTTDPSSQEAMLVREWVSTFGERNGNEKGGVRYFDKDSLDRIIRAYDKLDTKIRKNLSKVKNIKDSVSKAGKESNREAEEIKEDLIKFFDMIGIEYNIAGINNLLRDRQFQTKDDTLTIKKLAKVFSRNGLDFLMGDIRSISAEIGRGKQVPIVNKEGKTPLEDNKIVRLLARKQGEMLADLAEAMTLGAEGNLYSNYSTHTLMSSLISEWNEDPSKLDEIYGSRIADWMRENPDNKLKSYVLNNFKSLGKGDQGSKASDLTEPEMLAASVALTLSDGKTATYLGLAEADKSRQVALKGGNFESAGLVYRPQGTNLGERFTLANDNAVDILVEYFAQEVVRMAAIYENLYGENALPEEKRIKYLHEDRNTHTSYLFPEFNLTEGKKFFLEEIGIVTKEVADGKVRYKPNTLKAEDITSNRKLRFAIRQAFINAVNSDVNILNSYGIIQKEAVTDQKTGQVTVNYKNIGMDKRMLSSRYKGNTVEAIADYTLNSIIGSIETTKLFTGDPAGYKVKPTDKDLFGDFRKRIPAIIAGGTKARIYKDKNTKQQVVRPYYNSAVVSNIETPSDYFFPGKKPNQELLDNMVEAFNEGKPVEEHATKADMLSLISAYQKVNVTDAQAWITLDTFKERMLAFGKWTSEHQDAYERMTAKNPVLLPQDVKMFMQPLKTVHVEEMYDPNIGHRYLHYNKQSEAVIIPGLFPGLEAMAKANPEVDHFITLDGKKVGASGITTINDGNDVLPASEIKLNYVKLSNERLYLQQDLPTKQVKNTLVGSQIVKNLLGEVVAKATYTIPTANGGAKEITGEELINEYHQVVGLLSDAGYEALTEEFGVNPDTGKVNVDKYNEFLAKAMEEELTEAELESIRNGDPIDTIPGARKKLESKLMAEVRKKTIKLKQLGGAMVQMSGFGVLNDTISISGKVKDGIIWLKDVRDGLKPMQLNKKDGKLYTEKAQVLLPHKLVMELIGDDYKNMTAKEIADMIDPDVLMGISYRIPNQATSSNDVFEIVGILPPEVGDTIISYNEITTKTGSDFDIDKAFVILPNVEKRDGKLKRPKYAYEMTDEQAYAEKMKKDWLRSKRARELSLEKEKSLAAKKDAILAQIKELKGNEAVTKAVRDVVKEDENPEQYLITGDIVDLISRYFNGEKDALNEYRGKSLEESLAIRDKMLSLRANLQKINETVKNQVKEQLIAEGKIPTLEEFKKYDEVKKHTKAALENYRIDVMQALLADPKTYPNAVAALDNPFLENEAKELYESESSAATKNLGFWRGSTQAFTKVLFDKAKSLVGVVANQMTDHKITQADKLTYRNVNFQIGKQSEETGETLVSAITDENGVYTSTWLNLYMNAIVDAAKDPYIISANINQFTAPVGFMLIRAGVPAEWVNAYIGQPILKELVKLKSVREGRLSEKKYDKKTGKRITPENELIDKYLKMAKLSPEDYDKMSFKDLKKLKAEDLKKQVMDGKKLKANPVKQLVILKAFNEFKEYSKELSESIRVSKADITNGKSIISAELKEAKLVQLIEKNAIRNIESKFGASVDGNQIVYGTEENEGFVEIDGSRMAGTFHKNGIQAAVRMFSGMSIMSSNAVRNILYNIVFDLNPQLLNNEQSIDTLMNEIYSFVVGLEGSGITDGKIKDLFIGDNSVPRQIEKYKRANRREAAQNILLRDLSISYRTKEGEPDFLLFANKNQDRELYQQAWLDLFQTAPALAKQLVNYAYHSSGFNRNLFSIFQFIPTEELQNRGFNNFMKNVNIAFNSTDVLTEASDQIIKHLWNNPKIIPTVNNKKPVAEGVKLTEVFEIPDYTEYIVGVDEKDIPEVSRYLREKKVVQDNYGNTNTFEYLYELVGYSKETGNPIYKKSNKLGYSEAGKMVKEYFTPSNTKGKAKPSIFAQNNVSLSKEAKAFLAKKEYIKPGTVYSTLKDSVLYRTNFKSHVTEEQINEAIKNCKI